MAAALEAAEPQEGASIMPTLAQEWLAEAGIEGQTEEWEYTWIQGRLAGWIAGRQEGRVERILELEVQCRAGLLTGIEVALDLKFGAAGLALLPEVRAIWDVTLLEAVLNSIRGAANVEELRAVYRTAS